MYRSFNRKFEREIVVIQPGEYYVTDSAAEGIATVLGSCVAVCLIDARAHIRGMNHFMLPGDFRNEEIYQSRSGRYGMFAMESLINEMMKRGAKRENLTAKIFGGGHVLNFRRSDGNIPDANILFAKTYLAFEEIKLAASDVGGNTGRKIIFLDDSNGRVLVKKLAPDSVVEFLDEENRYKATMLKKKKEEMSGGMTLFDK
ncbi:MAG TPA: chemotaxis protein CheD [bacterium]|nr:chemotaxis protein CheD [bacterium]